MKHLSLRAVIDKLVVLAVILGISASTIYPKLALAQETCSIVGRVCKIDLSAYEKALIPWGHGKIVSINNYAAISPPNRYPSSLQSMQFMLFFNSNSNAGLYVQGTDPVGKIAEWRMMKENGKNILRITFFEDNPPAVIINRDFNLNPSKPHIAAGEHYRKWAFQQYWAKRKNSKADSIRFIGFGGSPSFSSYLVPKLNPTLDAFSTSSTSLNNPATATWLTLWRENNFDVNYPNYSPAPGAREYMSLLHSKGSAPMPYVNACVWHTDSTPDIFDADHMIKDAQGNMVHYGNTNMVYVCPQTTHWKNKLKSIREAQLIDADGNAVEGIYYDVLANTSPLICESEAHGHTKGDPAMWAREYREILSSTKDRVIMVEGFAEVYIDLVDYFLMFQYTRYKPNEEIVPLWDTVYGTISRSAGWSVDNLDPNPANIFEPRPSEQAVWAELNRARRFGVLTWGTPWYAPFGASQNMIFQQNMDGYLKSVRDKIAQPPILFTPTWGTNTSAQISSDPDPTYGGKTVFKLTASDAGIASTQPEWTQLSTGTRYTNARWSIKRAPNSAMATGFKVLTTQGDTVYLYYRKSPSGYVQASNVHYVYHAIGDPPTGQWQTLNRDLEADLQALMPGKSIADVKQFIMFKGSGSVADIMLFPHYDVPTEPDTAGMAVVPGKIEAEAFVRVNELTAQNLAVAHNPANSVCTVGNFPSVDVESHGDGCHVGWAQAGEWLEYDLNVMGSGYYHLAVRAATAEAKKYLMVEVDGQHVGGVFVKRSDWYSFADYTIKIPLKVGHRKLRLTFGSDSLNVDRLTLTYIDPGKELGEDILGCVNQEGMPACSIVASALAFHSFSDTSYHNEGTFSNDCISGSVDSEPSTGGGCNIGWTKPGEWVEYKFNIHATGRYKIKLYAAANEQGKSIRLREISENPLISDPASFLFTSEPIPVNHEGGWQAFESHEVIINQLREGVRRLRVEFSTGDVNLQQVEVVPL